MAKQVINIGTAPNDGTGDPLRTAMTKIISNFDELYDANDDAFSGLYTDLVNAPTLFANTDIDLHLNSASANTGDILSWTGSDWDYINPSTLGGGGGSYGDSNVDTHLNVSGASSGQILSWNGSDYAWIADATGGGGGGSVSNTDILNAVTAADLDMGGNRVLFNNVYSTLGDLPNASTYHGMFAHVHSTGAAYFAHSGNWVQLANNSDLGGGGGSGLQTRTSPSGVTASIADGITTDIDITGFKTYTLMSIETSAAAWVRIYATNSARTADNSRGETTDPAPDAGVIAEVITTGAETVLISPGAIGFNMESTPTTNIPVKVTNKSGSSAAITVTLQVLQLEA